MVVTGESDENLPMANVKEMLAVLNKSNKLEKDRIIAYSFLASSLDSQKDTTKTILQYSSQLFKFLSRDVLSHEQEVVLIATKIASYCAKDKQFLERVSKDETEALLLSVTKAGKEKQSESVTKQILCILSQNNFPSGIILPQIATILDALEFIYTEGNGKCIFSADILDVLVSLHETVGQHIADHAQRWCRMAFLCLGHPSPPVRAKSFDLITHYKSSLVGNLELGKHILKCIDNELSKPLLSLVVKNPQYVMNVWSLSMEIVGKAIHKGSTINVMLEIIENGFKGTAESRLYSFRAWRSLIDNFALDPDVISDSKRIRLVMMVLKTNNAKTEAVALEKLHTWWHFVTSIGSKLSSAIEQIVYPLLQFCMGNVNQASQNACPSPNFALKMSSPCASKALTSIQSRIGSQQLPTFPALQCLGFEVIGRLLSRLGGETSGIKWTIDSVPIEVFSSPANFVKHVPFIMSSLETLLKSVGKSVGSQDKEALILLIWRSLSTYLKAVLEKGGKGECRDVFSAFLSHFHTLVQADCFQPNSLVKLFQTTSDFPNKVLSSTLYNTGVGTAVKGCPALLLCEVMFMPAFLKVSSQEETYLQLFKGVVSAGASNQQGALSFVLAVTDFLDSASANLVSADLLYRLWSVLASTLLDNITATNEVNQGDALEYNFSCLYAVLLLPLKHQLASKVSQNVCKAILRTWKELYHSFARLSSLVTTAEANTCLEETSVKVIGVWKPEFKDPSNLEFLASVCLKMLDCADFSAISASRKQSGFILSPSKWTKRRQRPMANLHSFVHLLQKMQLESNALLDQHGDKTFTQKQSCSSGCLQSFVSTTADLYTRLFAHIPASVVSHVIAVLAFPMARLFNSKAHSTSAVKIFVPSINSKLEKLWFEMCNCVTSRYNEKYDSAFLASLSPLLEVTFPHSKRAIKNQTLTFWSTTFSKSVGLTYPDSLKPVLSTMKEKTAIVLPGWLIIDDHVIAETPFSEVSQSQGESQVPAPVLIGFPSPKRHQKGSFLNREISPGRRTSPVASKISPAKVISPKEVKSLFSSRRNISSELNMMSDKDFVVITSPTKKRRLLTEHQKEVLKEKRVIPAMYNNLDASQDTSLMAQLNTESQQESMSCADVMVIDSEGSQTGRGREKINISDSSKEKTAKDNSISSSGFTVPKQLKPLARRRSVRIQENSNDGEGFKEKDKSVHSKKIQKSTLQQSEKTQEKDNSYKKLLSADGKNDIPKQKQALENDMHEDVILSSLESSVEIPQTADTSSSTSDKAEVPAFGMFRTKSSLSNTLCTDRVSKNNSPSCNSPEKQLKVSLQKVDCHEGESSKEAPAVLKLTEPDINKGKSPRRVPLQRIHDQKPANQIVERETGAKKVLVTDLEGGKEIKSKDQSVPAEQKQTKSGLEKWLSKTSSPPKFLRRESPRKKRKFSDLEDEDKSPLETSPIIPILLVEDTQSPGKAGKPHVCGSAPESIAETPTKSDDSPSPVMRSVRKLFADDAPAAPTEINNVVIGTLKPHEVKGKCSSTMSLNDNDVETIDDSIDLSQGFVTTPDNVEETPMECSQQEVEKSKSSDEKATSSGSQEMPQSENLFNNSEEIGDSVESLMTMHMPTLVSQAKDFGISSVKSDSSSGSRTSSSVENDPKEKPISGTESEFDPSQATLVDGCNKTTFVVKKKTLIRETLASTRTRRSIVKRKENTGSSCDETSDKATGLSKVKNQSAEENIVCDQGNVVQETVYSSDQSTNEASVAGEKGKEEETSQKCDSNEDASQSQKEEESHPSLEVGETTPVVKPLGDNAPVQRCSTTKKKRLMAKELSVQRQSVEVTDSLNSESKAVGNGNPNVKSDKIKKKSFKKLEGRLGSATKRRMPPTVSPPANRSRHMLRMRTKTARKLTQSPPAKRQRFEKKYVFSDDSSMDDNDDDEPLSSLLEKKKAVPKPEIETVENVPEVSKQIEVIGDVSVEDDEEDQPLSQIASKKDEVVETKSITQDREENSVQDSSQQAEVISEEVVIDTCQDIIEMEDVHIQSSLKDGGGDQLEKEPEENKIENTNDSAGEMTCTEEEIPPGQVAPVMEMEDSGQSTGSDEVFDKAKDNVDANALGLTENSDKEMEVEIAEAQMTDQVQKDTCKDPKDKPLELEPVEGNAEIAKNSAENQTVFESEDVSVVKKCDNGDIANSETKGANLEDQKEEPEFVLSDWSPTKSPSCSILRKCLTPSSAEKGRRKVSFAEPVVSGESPVREKYHSESLPTSPLICLTRPGSPGIKPNRASSYRRRLESSMKKQVHNNLRQRGLPLPIPTPSPSSQNSYKATPESQLDSVNPIFPELVDCKVSLDCILPQLTSSLWYRGLCQLMKGRNLHTIGDLSALTEVQVNQMPIRCPKVDTVRDALTNYQNQHGGGASTPKSQPPKSIFGNATLSLEGTVVCSTNTSQVSGTPKSSGATLSQAVTPSSIADEGMKILPSAEQDLSQLSPIKDPNVKTDKSSTEAAKPPILQKNTTTAALASSSSLSSLVLSSSSIATPTCSNIVSVLSGMTSEAKQTKLKGLSMAQLFDLHQELNNLFGVVVEEMKERSFQSQ